MAQDDFSIEDCIFEHVNLVNSNAIRVQRILGKIREYILEDPLSYSLVEGCISDAIFRELKVFTKLISYITHMNCDYYNFNDTIRYTLTSSQIELDYLEIFISFGGTKNHDVNDLLKNKISFEILRFFNSNKLGG